MDSQTIEMGIEDKKREYTMNLYVDMHNPLPDIRQARVAFLRYWMIKIRYRVQRPPEINLFFVNSYGERVYVTKTESCCCNEKKNRIVLDRETMDDPRTILQNIFVAYERFIEWQEQSDCE